MTAQIIKTLYYVEICIEGSETCVMQSKAFTSQEKAESWYVNNFDFVDKNCVTAYLMSMEYYSKDAFDIDQIKEL